MRARLPVTFHNKWNVYIRVREYSYYQDLKHKKTQCCITFVMDKILVKVNIHKSFLKNLVIMLAKLASSPESDQYQLSLLTFK